MLFLFSVNIYTVRICEKVVKLLTKNAIVLIQLFIKDQNDICIFQLLQPTIESLLPADDGDDEGYELSSVLNKSVGTLQCIVTGNSEKMASLQQINIF